MSGSRYIKAIFPHREKMDLVTSFFSKLTNKEREVIMDHYCYECGRKLLPYKRECKCGNKNIHGFKMKEKNERSFRKNKNRN